MTEKENKHKARRVFKLESLNSIIYFVYCKLQMLEKDKNRKIIKFDLEN